MKRRSAVAFARRTARQAALLWLALPSLVAAEPGRAGRAPRLDAAVDAAVAAAAAVRVGDGLGALVAAASLAADDPVAPLLVARARLALGEPGLALDALGLMGEVSDESHAGPGSLGAWVALEVRLAAADAPARVQAEAERLLGAGDLPESAQALARLWAAAAAPPAAGPTRARADLERLAVDRAHRTLRPRALAALATDDPAAARALCVEFPTDPAAPAPERLVPPLDAEDRHARAEALFAARAYAEVEAADAPLLADAAAPPRLKQAAHLRAATGLLRLFERDAEALAHAEAAARGPDAALRRTAHFRRSLVLGRMARYDAARAATEDFLAAGATGSLAREARYQLGRLLHQAGRFAEAAPVIAAFAAAQPPADRNTWRWFVGWAHFRAGDCPAARAVFAELFADANLLVGPKARYWTARCQVIEGDPPAALASLDALAAVAPLSYYGALGQRLAHRLDPARPRHPARPPGAPFAVPSAELAAVAAEVPRAARADFAAAHQRVRAGYPELAAPFADRVLAARPPEAVREALSLALERFGARWIATPGAERRLAWLAEGPEADPARLRAALPPAWPELGARVEALHGVSRWWIMGHLLQESRYQARARSHAGALGPMQILPRTGRRIAAALDFPPGDFLDDALYDAGVALRHGAWYLAALRDEFGGQVLWAMAAYNGGPRRMVDHFVRVAGLPLDVQAEELGAHESRNYLRKVADHAIRYAALYGTEAEYTALVSALVDFDAPPDPRGVVDF